MLNASRDLVPPTGFPVNVSGQAMLGRTAAKLLGINASPRAV